MPALDYHSNSLHTSLGLQVRRWAWASRGLPLGMVLAFHRVWLRQAVQATAGEALSRHALPCLVASCRVLRSVFRGHTPGEQQFKERNDNVQSFSMLGVCRLNTGASRLNTGIARLGTGGAGARAREGEDMRDARHTPSKQVLPLDSSLLASYHGSKSLLQRRWRNE